MKAFFAFVLMAYCLQCFAFSKNPEEVCQKAAKVMVTESCSDDAAMKQKARDCLKNCPSEGEKIFLEVTGTGSMDEAFDKVCGNNDLVKEVHDTMKKEGLEMKEDGEKYGALRDCLEEFDD